jgi:hypothetical protein
MTSRTGRLSACALVAGLACSLAQAQLLHPELDAYADGISAELERQLFSMLPQDQQGLIAHAQSLARCTRLPDQAAPEDVLYEHVAGFISRQGFDEMAPGRRFMLASVVRNSIDGVRSPAFCFEPGSMTDEEAWAFTLALFGDNARYQQTNRWNSTALSGGGLGQGDPTTITYSFPPDGTNIPNLGIGVGSGANALHAWLNGRYGSQSAWQPLFDAVFDRWSDLTGLSYVYEPNDDGAQLNGAAGVAGVRGDVRIGAFNFQNDGNGGVLAYNNFPQDGDMVLDAFDTFFNQTGGNSIRLRNVVAHEHGHGIGMLHVCPANGTKLMEPFISTGYDGPQVDDILNGNRHYGDANENNDTVATATQLGDPGFGTVITNVSIDDNSDVDYYGLGIAEPRQILIQVTPRGGEYQQGTQTGQCNSGGLTNYDIIHDLSVQIIDTDGTSVLVDVNDNPPGDSEFAGTVAIDPGTYFVRVAGDSTNSAQLYDIGFSLLSPDPIVVEAATPPPSIIASGEHTSFDVRVTEVSQNVTSANLRYRADGGAFATIPLDPQGAGLYTANLPAPACGDHPEFYIEVVGSEGFTQDLPDDGAAGPFTAVVGTQNVVLNDNAETNIGWTVSGTATDGQWDRGVPAGLGDRGDPTTDGDGSGAAWLTDNVAGNSDIDNGVTTMTSPALDASHPESTISYWTWFSNTTGAAPNADIMTVEVSGDNGVNWTILEVIGPDGDQVGGGWFHRTFRVADFVATTSQFRIRFSAGDEGQASVVEAGVDGLMIQAFSCEDTTCLADFNNDGELDFFDVQAYLAAFSAHDPAADLTGDGTFDFFDVQQFLNAFSNGCP